jgi:hypothetical protein
VDKEAMAQAVETFSAEFNLMTTQRHEKGAEKYGPGKFLTVDTLEEALFELADLSNYARYSFIRIRLLQMMLAEQAEGQALTVDFSQDIP